ncbi:MAG: AI-2E family transporter [Myxococcota bacterium]
MSSPREEPAPVQVPRWLRVLGAYGWRFVAAAAAFYVLLYVAHELRLVVLPFVFGVVLATLLEPIARFLHEHKLPRALSAVIAMLVGLGVLGGLLTLFGFGVAGELPALGEALGEGYREVIGWLAHSPLNVTPSEVSSWVDEQLENLQSSAGSMAKEVASSVARVVTALGMLLVTIVFAVFFAWDGDRLFDRLVRVFPERQRVHVRAMGDRIWQTVGNYMRGMFLIATADAVLFGIGLWIIGVPLVLPLMLLMFLGAFVPYAGPVVATTTAILVALANGGFVDGAFTLLAGVVVQATEGNLLHPVLMGRAVALHPVSVLIAVTAGGALAGVAGVFLAIPVMAAIKQVLVYAREQGAV